jgi:hypothetical protein
MFTHAKIPSGVGARRDQTYHEDEHDTYKLQGKLKEPTEAVAADWHPQPDPVCMTRAGASWENDCEAIEGRAGKNGHVLHQTASDSRFGTRTSG